MFLINLGYIKVDIDMASNDIYDIYIQLFNDPKWLMFLIYRLKYIDTNHLQVNDNSWERISYFSEWSTIFLGENIPGRRGIYDGRGMLCCIYLVLTLI